MKTKDNREFVGLLVATMNDIISALYFVGSSSTASKCSTTTIGTTGTLGRLQGCGFLLQ